MTTKQLTTEEYNLLRDNSEVGSETKYGTVTKYNRMSVIVKHKKRLIRLAPVCKIATTKHQIALLNYLSATKQTAAQAAIVLGVSPSYLSCVRNGTKPLSKKIIDRMYDTVLEAKK